MDEDIAIINKNTRDERIKNFFKKNLKKIITFFSIITFFLVSYFIYIEYKQSEKLKISNRYNSLVINFNSTDKTDLETDLIEIIYKKDKTYSPLALYFLLDNNVIKEKNQVNELFDFIINQIKLNKEIKNLVIYKKALFNSEFKNENELMEILKPIMNTDSIWKSHALYLMGEYFYFKKEKQKAKEFFDQILIIENANQDIKLETQKILNRDFSD